ncbi:Tripeptidyl-peptidase sed4 [Cladobotryum mycophilum]|uniref:tripeptidyl-peptidase II n=1 Tax=Cladobotryum mycophilum TaxID=491253 RepID=A0ABR0SZK0_9HYPO
MSDTLRLLSLVAALTPTAFAGVHGVLDAVPGGWTIHNGMAAADSELSTFTIALSMSNLDNLESMLMDVATPGNENWLQESGVAHYKVEGSFIDFAADIPTVNKLFNADYQYYRSGAAIKLRTLQYSIPDHIQQHIEMVDPATFFGTPTAFKRSIKKESLPKIPRRVADNASCAQALSPGCVKQLYNVGDYEADPASGSRIGFSSFLNQSALYSDAFLYETAFEIPAQNFSVELIAGGINNQDPKTAWIREANLDAQNIIGVAHPLPITEFITGGSPPFIPDIGQPTAADNRNEPYLPYYRYLLSQPRSKLPQVISNSYGDVEDTVPYYYAKFTCDLIGIMGLRGISILVSSGDLGVGGGCLSTDNKTVQFDPIFPATCPYVTAVGGTVAVSPEIAWVGSSGGFSKYFKRPLYQERAIREYLGKLSAETQKFYGQYTNFNGRGFPDISAHSVSPRYTTYYAGKAAGNGGTSAAAPVVAAIVALLNDARLQAGKSPLGWLNPLFYAFGPKVLTDIVGGYSIGCNGNNTQSGKPEPSNAGRVPGGAQWNATEGWDPVTGYGTPDFQKIKDLVLSY